MSPSPTTFSLEPSVPVPIPPPPVIDEDAPVETPTMGKTTSQMVPMRPAIPLEDYVSGQPQRSRTQAPSSPGMSDFGTLNLPYSRTASRVPFEVRHFEIERSPSREKINRKNKEVTRISYRDFLSLLFIGYTRQSIRHLPESVPVLHWFLLSLQRV